MKKHKGSGNRGQKQNRGNQTKKRLELQKRARARGQAEHQYSCHERKRARRSRVPPIAECGVPLKGEESSSALEQAMGHMGRHGGSIGTVMVVEIAIESD